MKAHSTISSCKEDGTLMVSAVEQHNLLDLKKSNRSGRFEVNRAADVSHCNTSRWTSA